MTRIWLIGAGIMAQDYNKILSEINCEYCVIGRGEESAKIFEEKTGTSAITGGVNRYISSGAVIPEYAIVSTGVEALAGNCISLVKAGVKKILVEKPSGINSKEIENVCSIAKEHNSEVFVAYNRRFFSSVERAREIICDDGGVMSFNFEFTEWAHVIQNIEKADGVMENWVLANSTHVIDLAFFLGGRPDNISTFSSGALSWHKRSSVFSGAGISESGALFSYHANWEAPGRWGVEILTPKHRLYLRPMEQLQIQKIGSILVEKVEIDDSFDQKYKPGLYKQVNAFILGDVESLCTIRDQAEMVHIYEKIAGYNAKS